MGAGSFKWLTRGIEVEKDLLPDADRLPATAEYVPPRAQAKIAAACGLVFAALALALAFFLDERFMSAFVGVVGILMMAMAVHALLSRQEWQFTSTEVRCTARGLLGRTRWTEPLSHYEGVTCKQYRVQGLLKSRMIVRVILKHRWRRLRSVVLYQKGSPDGLRANQNHYARLFNLPALDEARGAPKVRQPQDLGKSIRTQVAEGRLMVNWELNGSLPGRNLSVRLKGDEIRISSPAAARALVLRALGRLFIPWRGGLSGTLTRTLITSALVFAIIAGPIIRGPFGFRFFRRMGPLVFLGVAALVGCVLGVRGLLGLLKEELVISTDQVARQWRGAWRTWGRRVLTADEVEEVAIRPRRGKRGALTVQVIAGAETLHFGLGLKRAEKDWVRDCIIAVISEDA